MIIVSLHPFILTPILEHDFVQFAICNLQFAINYFTATGRIAE
jgi:hypothetical protein